VDERSAWITLASVQRIGELTIGRLLAEFGNATEVLRAVRDGRVAAWNAERQRIEDRPPLDRTMMEGLLAAARRPAALLDPIGAAGLWTTTPLDVDFPARLRDLDPPPPLIHGLGDRSAIDRTRMVAVVGTRRPTAAGRLLAARVGARLVECGAVIVSGLAVGIDGAAHAATIERGGTTVGVIGAGHGHPGVHAHRELRTQLVGAGGALISEHHPSTRATVGTYPRRNRIIAALADAVVVIEAPARSGALITARHGLELGRQVLVAPGRIEDWSVRGSLALLREAPARPLVGLDEMVEDLGYLAAPATAAGEAQTAREPALAMLGQAERTVAERLCRSPCGLDVLVADTGLPAGVVSSAVTLLLLRGWAQPMGPAYLPAGPLVGGTGTLRAE